MADRTPRVQRITTRIGKAGYKGDVEYIGEEQPKAAKKPASTKARKGPAEDK